MKRGSFRVVREERGCLMPFNMDQLPIDVRRIFVVTGVPAGSVRGNHAHKKNKNVLVCLQGAITVNLYDGETTKEEILLPGDWVLVEPMIWDSQIYHSGNDVLLSLCSEQYDPDDYIRDPVEYDILRNGACKS